MVDKSTLRQSLLATRAALPIAIRTQWDAAIRQRVLAWWETQRMPSLGIFWPMRHEPDLRPLYDDLADLGIALALPVVIAHDAPLAFVPWRPGDALVKDALGVSIPAQTKMAIHPGALLIPCVGFNRERIRLGYGGGFYDRTLAAAGRPLAIGIGYTCALAHFQGEPHDIALDAILTETACF